MTKYKKSILLASAALGLILPTATAYAQEAKVTDEIIVTARKKSESLQSVPLAITAFTAIDIQNAGIDNVEDIALLTPGFTFAPLFGGGASTPVIRGQSTTIGEPNVGFFVDGVYQSSRSIMDAMLGGNIERVEIAKGPQSALYGRNTFAGAVNFVTKKPSNEMSGQVEATAGNGGHYALRGNVSGPLAEDSVYFQLGGVYSKHSGFFTNELTGDNLDERESTILTGALMFTPSENLEIVARIGYDATRDGDDPARFLVSNASPANPTPAPLPPALQLFSGEVPSFETGFAVTPGHSNHDNLILSLSADLEMDSGYTLTSITGYNNLDVDNATDNDYEARSIRYTTQLVDQKELSQEIRITSPQEQRFSWMAGAYYYDLDTTTDTVDTFVDGALGLATALAGSPLGGLLPAGIINNTNEQTQSFALFGYVDFDISEQLTATLEGRWTSEEKQAIAVDTNPLTLTSATFDQTAKFDNFVPRFTLDYQMNDTTLLYGSVSKAVKAGGFNVVTTAGAILDSERTYAPEKSWNYEVGVKTNLGDSTTLNVAAFKIDWNDQIVRALGATFAVLNANAGKTSVQGIEVELRSRLTDNLDFTGGFAYTDSAYDSYTFGAIAALGGDPVLDGNRLQYVSEVTANASLQYSQPVSDTLDWKSRIDLAYQSDQNIVQTDDAFSGDTTLVNVRTGIDSGNWELLVWVDNLFEEDSAVTGVFIPNQASRFDTANSLVNPTIPVVGFQAFNALAWSRNPREWGVTARYKF
jgi:iron complex outermembrane receptor protein